LAERAAWEFHNSLPEAERFELVLCLPSLVLGPNLVPGDFSSQMYMKGMLLGVMPGLPKMWFPIVDVRDVAQAHLNAIKVPEARN
jgi:nucleoside-diphosphate-sugar epimerase